MATTTKKHLTENTLHIFLHAGMNSILLYLGHQTASQMLPFNFSHGSMNTHWIRCDRSMGRGMQLCVQSLRPVFKQIFAPTE
jgi:hypothetical protein